MNISRCLAVPSANTVCVRVRHKPRAELAGLVARLRAAMVAVAEELAAERGVD